MVRNECGTIVHLVMFDTDHREKSLVAAPANAEALFGRYPLYNENMDVIGNKGLIILEKTGANVKLMTCAGIYVDDGVEEQIIAKAQRLNMRIVNAAVLAEADQQKHLYTL